MASTVELRIAFERATHAEAERLGIARAELDRWLAICGCEAAALVRRALADVTHDVRVIADTRLAEGQAVFVPSLTAAIAAARQGDVVSHILARAAPPSKRAS